MIDKVQISAANAQQSLRRPLWLRVLSGALSGAVVGALVGVWSGPQLIDDANLGGVLGGAVMLGALGVAIHWSKPPWKRMAWGLAGAALGAAVCSIPLLLRYTLVEGTGGEPATGAARTSLCVGVGLVVGGLMGATSPVKSGWL